MPVTHQFSTMTIGYKVDHKLYDVDGCKWWNSVFADLDGYRVSIMESVTSGTWEFNVYKDGIMVERAYGERETRHIIQRLLIELEHGFAPSFAFSRVMYSEAWFELDSYVNNSTGNFVTCLVWKGLK